MKISDKGIELIKHFEGCELHAYKDVATVNLLITTEDRDLSVAMSQNQHSLEASPTRHQECHGPMQHPSSK